MDRIQYFAWLAKQASGGIAYLGFISLGLLVALLVALALNNPFQRNRYRSRNWWVVSPVLITFMILLVGTLFEHVSGTPLLWPQLLNTALGFLHVPLLGLLLWKLPGIRWFTAAVNLVIMWCSLWAWVVSTMSISGDWM
jgi:hypothetical protein